MHKISCTVAEKVAAWLEFSVTVFVQGVHTYNDNVWSSSTLLHVTQGWGICQEPRHVCVCMLFLPQLQCSTFNDIQV